MTQERLTSAKDVTEHQQDLVEKTDGETGADPAERLPRRFGELRAAMARTPFGNVAVLDLLVLAGLTVLLAFLWGRAIRTWLWVDEGIAAGIASHPLRDIPELMRQDGSPPLYYALLHAWMSVFGTSEVQTHALSLLFGLAMVPAALWAGWSLYGRRTGWTCAILVALSPFLSYYVTETRMYSMVALLGLLTVTTFIHGFVFGRRVYLPAFVVLLTLLMYTHNWGVLVALGTAAALVPCFVFSSQHRRMVMDATLCFGVVGLLYLPWLPSLLYQRGQQLQPWAEKAVLVDFREGLKQVVGGNELVIVLGLGAAAGLIVMMRKPWGRSAMGVIVVAVVTAVALVGGWQSSVFTVRYLAALAGPILLVLGAGLARGGRAGVAALWVAAFIAVPIGVKGPPYTKSNARAVAEQAGAVLRPEDLVLVPDVHMVPLLAYYLPSELRFVTTLGPVRDTRMVDWRHMVDRLRDGDPERTVGPLLDALPSGARVFMACPPIGAEKEATGLQGEPASVDTSASRVSETPDQTTPDQATTAVSGTVPPPEVHGGFHYWMGLRCIEVTTMLLSDPTLRLEKTLQPPSEVRNTAVLGRLFTKV